MRAINQKKNGPAWNALKRDDRKLILLKAYPDRSMALLNFESERQWDELLPSTQIAVTYVDWPESA